MTTEEKAKAYDEALERARRIKNGEDDWRYSDLIEIGPALTEIFPELRESEDEITRKRLINLIRELASATVPIMTGGYFIDGQDKRYIAYLEKQKDAFENGRQLGIMQEQARQELGWPDEKKKEHQNNSDAPEKALGRDLISPKDKDTNLDEIAQDYVDGVKEYNPEPTWDLIQTAVCYGYHYCEQKEQKPDSLTKYVYSKEDKKFIQDCANILVVNDYATSAERLLSMFEQKPAEWSEEDEHRRKDAIYLLESAMKHYADTSEIDKTIDWLKSLRPSWKPSEWQMSMLLAVINDPNNAGSESCYLTLKSIYEQLKKL